MFYLHVFEGWGKTPAPFFLGWVFLKIGGGGIEKIEGGGWS